MYQHSDSINISLHDCRATKILYSDNMLSFVFKDGFEVSEHNKYNNYNKTAYTDESEVKFKLLSKKVEANITIYTFSETDNKNISIREEIPFTQFADSINNGMELEFLYSYSGYNSFIYECWLWFNEEPYHKECVLIISADDVKYFWNNIFVDE